MKKYKVKYSGFVYVNADSADEARDMYTEDDIVYREEQADSVEEVDEFAVEV